MNKEKILQEIILKAVRSSGAGGQNVNKVSSKIVLSFAVADSFGLDEAEKLRIASKLSSRLTQDNVLMLNCDEDRSQLKNKAIAIKRLFQILQNALVIPKERKETAVPKSVIRKRIKDKKNLSATKGLRRKPNLE